MTKGRVINFVVKGGPKGIFRWSWSHFWVNMGAKNYSSYWKNTLTSTVLCWFLPKIDFWKKWNIQKFRIKQCLLTKSRINNFVVKGGPKGIFCIMGPLLVWKNKSWKSWKKIVSKLERNLLSWILLHRFCSERQSQRHLSMKLKSFLSQYGIPKLKFILQNTLKSSVLRWFWPKIHLLGKVECSKIQN